MSRANDDRGTTLGNGERQPRDRQKFSGEFTDAWVKKAKPQPKEVQYAENLQKGLSLMLYIGAENTKKQGTTAKTWRVLFYHQGKPRAKKLGTYPELKVEAARDAAREFKPAREIAAKAAGTFEEVAEKWLDEYVRKKRLRSEAEIVRQLKTYVYPILGKTKIHDIKRRHVNDLLADIEHKRIQYSPADKKKKKNKARRRVGGPAQANAVLATIRAVMGWWETQDDEYVSPIVKGMERDKRSSDERARERVLDDGELRAVWAACGDLGIFGAFVRMLIVTAQRRNTVAAMMWGDVVDGLWTIPNEHREKGHIGAVRLPRLALDILDKQPRVNEYVFPAIHKGLSVLDKPLNSFSQGKDELDRLLPDDMPDWTLHDLRRTARTRMAGIGISDTIAERTLGHKLQGVMKVYNRHAYLDEKSEALQRLSDHIALVLNPTDGPNVIPFPSAATA
jgi:integrase